MMPFWTDKERRVHVTLAVLFTLIAVVCSWQLIVLTQRDAMQDNRMQEQVDCNANLITVLRKRSDAMQTVDTATREAQQATIAVLQDIQEGGVVRNDAHVSEAIRKFGASVAAREQPELSTPYVDCRR